ncbi:hypothetical protein SUGI_0707850 [Cryptomeria japonica]|nr:hypothetical protein SUGI_0707850 [Cryptomeria japonica]
MAVKRFSCTHWNKLESLEVGVSLKIVSQYLTGTGHSNRLKKAHTDTAQGRYQTLYVTSFIHNYRHELARYPALTTGNPHGHN